ncbi:MAG: hypothetical protein AAF517_06675, partial [Planctomycetota bacterium]
RIGLRSARSGPTPRARSSDKWLSARLFASIFGISYERAAEIASVVDGFPDYAAVEVFTDGDETSVIEFEVVSIRLVSFDEDFFEPDDATAERPPISDLLLLMTSPTYVERRDLFRDIVWLESRLGADQVDRLRSFWMKKEVSFEVVVEWMRLAYRLDRKAAMKAIQPLLYGEDIRRMLAAGEALAAENAEEVFEFFARVLNGSFSPKGSTEEETTELIRWAIRLLRVTSGLSLSELLDVLPDDEGADRVLAEYQFWTDWLKKRSKSETP